MLREEINENFAETSNVAPSCSCSKIQYISYVKSTKKHLNSHGHECLEELILFFKVSTKRPLRFHVCHHLARDGVGKLEIRLYNRI